MVKPSRESWLARKISELAHHIIKSHIKRVVKDQVLAEKLTPDYDLGCKRITPSDTYLQVSQNNLILRIMFIATHQFEEASTFAGIQQRLCESDHHKDRPSDKDWGENGGWAGASS